MADVHRISVGANDVRGRFTFRRKGLDLTALAALAGRKATAILERIGAAGEEEPEGAETKEPAGAAA